MELISINYHIVFFSNWHCGSGLASGSNADSLVIKDNDGLPYVPGKTVKGLIRQAYEELFGENVLIFGKESGYTPGTSFFSDARLLERRSSIIQERLQSELYTYVSSTAIDPDGIASSHSLRNTQVAIPCTLEGDILSVPKESFENLKKAAGMIKELGLHRSRGLGRCQFILSEATPPPYQDATIDSSTRTLQFRCHLKSDIILNQDSGNKTQNKTLDFIPGNNFLGIVAQAYGSFSPDDAATVFHSGKVRFSDAHPAIGNNRSLRVPFSLYYPKLESARENTYQHHLITDADSINLQRERVQLKQCRTGFYDLSESPATQAHVDTRYSIKSAYDREKRRSKDESMFLYESVGRGIDLFFYVDVDADVKDDLVKKIYAALIGEHRLGRSRSAQYGLVVIEPATFDQPKSVSKKQKRHSVYADGRLIFLDQYGLPTFRPTASDLGFKPDAKINWSLSQIRTFSYAPWNGKRESFDTERCGIEKGSVFIVDSSDEVETPHRAYTGYYNNEGFGRVLYNPCFLDKAFLLVPHSDDGSSAEPDYDNTESNLLCILKSRKAESDRTNSIYQVVNEWKTKYGSLFFKDGFSSQWGTIRSIAISGHNQGLHNLLTQIIDYTDSGVASTKWEGKKDLLTINFVNSLKDKGIREDMIWQAIVNLSSVMAKSH